MMNELNIKCEVCGKGYIVLDVISTLEDIPVNEVLTYDGTIAQIDHTIDKAMVFKCNICGSQVKYTIRRYLEKQRDLILAYLLERNAMNLVVNTPGTQFPPYYLIYCGKCGGQDGEGSCSQEVYDKCDIKEFPIG